MKIATLVILAVGLSQATMAMDLTASCTKVVNHFSSQAGLGSWGSPSAAATQSNDSLSAKDGSATLKIDAVDSDQCYVSLTETSKSGNNQIVKTSAVNLQKDVVTDILFKVAVSGEVTADEAYSIEPTFNMSNSTCGPYQSEDVQKAEKISGFDYNAIKAQAEKIQSNMATVLK